MVATTGRTPTAKPTKPKTADDYLAAAPKDKRAVLMKLRTTIKAAAPKATEGLAHGIVGYKHGGNPIRFPTDKPPPDRLVTKLVKARMAEIERAG